MPEPATGRSVRRWWNRVTATILALGALAGAIGAILALRPAPDPEDSASISVQADSPISLSEAQAWLRARAPQGAGSGAGQDRPAPVRRLQPDPSTTSQTDPTSGTSAPDPSSSSSSDTTASSSETTSSTPSTIGQPTSSGPETAPSVEIAPPAGFGQEEFRAHVEQVLERAQERAPGTVPEGCIEGPYGTCIVYRLAEAQAMADGKPVDPEIAAERLVKLLRNTRRTGGGGSRAREPLGVLVTVNLQLIGLRDQEVLLTWSMLAARGGAKRLYGDWLNDNLAYRLKAGSNSDSAFEYIWIPLPRSPGPYYVRAELRVDGSPLASQASDPFN